MPTRPQVVVADDNRALRMCVVDLLAPIAVDIVEVASTHELRSLMETGRFDAVITDVRMPGGSGIDVLRDRRAAGDPTPFVVMTGACPEDMAARVRHFDSVIVLPKPFTVEDLHAALAHALGRGLDTLAAG